MSHATVVNSTFGEEADVARGGDRSLVISSGSPSAGEWLLLLAQTGNSASRKIVAPYPSGFTLLDEINFGGVNFQAFAKQATAGEPSTYTCTLYDDYTYAGAILHVIQGIGDPMGLTITASSGPGSGTITCPSINIGTDDTVLMHHIFFGDKPSSMTQPAGETKIAEFVGTLPYQVDTSIGASIKDVNAGPTGTADWSYTPTYQTGIGVSLQLPPIVAQRIRNATHLFNDRPFAGDGYSLYANEGTEVEYRNLRILGAGRKYRRRGGWIKGTGENHDIAADSVLKTARRTSAAGSPIAWPLPEELRPTPGNTKTVSFDVRHFKDDVENETDNFRTATIEVDENLDPQTEILGTVTVLAYEQLAGGVVRLRFVYHASRDGVQPTLFRAIATAGPTSPADATIDYYEGLRLIEIETPALSDASPYTYTIRAENGATTKDMATGLAVTADATGPPAPTAGTTEVF